MCRSRLGSPGPSAFCVNLICVQLDAGQHPAYDGLAALPFFDDFDLSTVDVLLISQ
jgi:hypothetical protein